MRAGRQARAVTRAALLLALAVGPERLPAQRLPFTGYNTDDGLPATQVWHLLEDRRGYLWIATTWGLARYDGVAFSTLSVPQGLPSANLRLSLEDPSGALWIGTNAGLARYDGERVTSFADQGGALAATIWAAGIDRHGVAWFGTDRGLVAAVGETFRTYGRADGLADDYVYSLLLARDGAIWLGSRGHGVTRCNVERGGRLGACRVFGEAQGLLSGSVRAIVEDGTGNVYLATRGAGLARFDGQRFEHRWAKDGMPGDDLYSLLVDRGGNLLVGSADHGLAICPLPGLTPCLGLSQANGLGDDGVRALFEDREGTLWIGTEGGLVKLARRDLWSYGEAEGLPDHQVYGVASDRQGGVWVGTFDGLAHLAIDPQGRPTIERWRRDRGLPANWVWAVLADRRGDVWAGTEGGLARLRNGRVVDVFRAADGLAGDYVVGLAEDRQGALWVASIDGLARLRFAGQGRPEITRFGVEQGLAKPRCYAVAEDGDGRLWVAHGEGLSRWDGKRFAAVDASSDLDLRAARTLGVGRDGTLWVGGYGQLAHLILSGPTPRFAIYGVRSGLSDLLILTIAESESGHLLLGTNHGVFLFDPVARQGEGAIVARFDHATGLLSAEISHSSAFAWDSQGRAWFGFKGGLTAFPRGFAPAHEMPPPELAFERLDSGAGRLFQAPFSGSAGGGRLLGGGPVVLPHGDRDLRIAVRARTLRGEQAVRYQYQLQGLESEWSEAKAEPFRYYTNLDPGEYRLRARAAIGAGAWGEPVELALRLEPAWFQTRSARAGAMALLGVLVYAAVWLRTRRVERRNRELARLVDERTDDLARYARALEENVDALDRANERIRQADRYRAEFLAKMSHELRTPLTSVLGFAALLGDGLEGRMEARHARYLANIRESGNHLLRLINNLLDQAKIEAGGMDLHLEPAALEAIVESAAGLMEGYAATRGVRLTTRHLQTTPPILVDVAKLRQITINLLSNAIKFSPAGSEVSITTRRVGAASSELGVESYEVIVTDQGPGIAPEHRERIFEPFRQLAARGETIAGTGLGLPIVRQFVQLLGGQVEVRSPGVGTAFHVLLPVDAAARATGARASSDQEPSPGDRPRVVVLEPDRGRFTAVAGDLDREGFLAVRAPDLEEARRMVRELRPAVVALDLDPVRPEAWRVLVGLEHELARAELPLVLFAFAPGSVRGVAVGFDRCLALPVDLVLLGATVRQRMAPRSASSGGAVCLALGEGAASHELEAELARLGLEAVRPASRPRAQAELAGGRFAAVVIDLADGETGGLDLACGGQSEGMPHLPWVALVRAELAAAERQRLVDLVTGARGATGLAVVAAVRRLIATERPWPRSGIS